MKQLVTGDFDRFVRCKNGIDEVYERMVEGGFSAKDAFGTAKVKQILDGMAAKKRAPVRAPVLVGTVLMADSTKKAQELYNPVLDSRAKAERLRVTLIILSRHKEYFNLPSLIASDIKRVQPLLPARTLTNCSGRHECAFAIVCPCTGFVWRVHRRHAVDVATGERDHGDGE